jgi:hypothetical protein
MLSEKDICLRIVIVPLARLIASLYIKAERILQIVHAVQVNPR